MPRHKRTRDEAELDIPLEPEVQSQENVATLSQLRNMWEFASLMQYIYLFGHAVKIDDDFDTEDLEAECLKPQPSAKLAQIGLALLKFVSSHRGLTPEIFDEYARRQFTTKAPRRNPFGEEEEPSKFNEFDIFTKIRVLQQLSTWTLGNAERIRGIMPQEEDHLNWRMEPLGWDKEDRAYFVLDDNRLYRRTDEPPPPPTPKPKAKSKAPKKSKSKATRASKRRKIEEMSEDDAEEQDADGGVQEDTVMTNGDHVHPDEDPGYGFTDKTWECIAITLEEYQDFLATIFRTKDPNEKQLRKRIEEDVLPIIEKRAEASRQKQLKKIRELENLQKMATAKRSGRIAEKAEKERQEREEREVEEKRQADLRMAHEEQERQRRIEEGHESRRLTREQRVKEREVKRILHEEELAKIEDQATRASSQDPTSDTAVNASKRLSERQLKTKKEQHKKELEKLAEDDDKWYFDCAICGMHGENFDDGSHSIACERCSVWQHSKCHGFSPKQAEKDGFHFVCSTCKRKEEDAKKPKIAPLKLSRNKRSTSPEGPKSGSRPSTANGARGALPDHVARQLGDVQYYMPPQHPNAGPYRHITNGPSLSPFGQAQGPPGYRYPPVGNFAPHHHQVPPPQQPWQGSPMLPQVMAPSPAYASSPPQSMANGLSSPHQHQQQHQNMHHNAVAASGGHSAYQVPYQAIQQPNGYSPRAPTGMYPITQPPQHLQQYHQNTYYNAQVPPQRPGSSHLMNGFQSPTKNSAISSKSPPQQHPSYTQPPHHTQQRLEQSPNATFPPSAQPYHQHNAQSSAKSSPSAGGQMHPQPYQQRPLQHLAPSPSPAQHFRPPSSSGPLSNHQTPQHHQQQSHPSPASSNANGVATDGMSGPWPAGSQAIPQKHDMSPAPPPAPQATQQTRRLSTSQGTQTSNAGTTVSSVPPVALSPSQQMQEQAQATGSASVPVKKMPASSPSGTQQPMQSSIAGSELAFGPTQVPTLEQTPIINGAAAQQTLSTEQQQRHPPTTPIEG